MLIVRLVFCSRSFAMEMRQSVMKSLIFMPVSFLNNLVKYSGFR